ncbi:MAG: DeoR/GlpR family DNA-binding transcription regulator [Spirochaetales bacterium]|uniref:DeoR/GlpR family DNA-binding transcription regulator n=1 Tax=Candidatus Thalassospirochaeta sargassi TaxID=3119039 RepID=A0AAJ1IF70_9SPIO|nr:DeoR/GlpR family DNA-binding transcription regulator [Spirochaetales bacterium]
MNNLTERERKIIDILSEEGKIGVTAISERLKVSKVTVRSDFANLVEKGVIYKTHGGAIPAMHPDILERQRDMTDVKRAIAKEAASMVEDGDTVMIVAGTTTAMIGNFLLGKRDIRIVTNSTLLLPYARMNPSLNLTIVGGEFRPQAEAMVGPETIRQLDEFHVKKAFIGTEGFSYKGGLTTQLVESSETIRKMVERTEQTILVADSGKYNKIGFVKILPLERMDLIITDNGLDKEVINKLNEKGLNLRLV